MKKFILVDNEGNTPDKQHIETGKFHISEGEMDKSVAAIMNSGDNSPILAVMNYPGALDASMKMFLLNVWDMEGQGYSMIKEVELPAITAEHKLAFAIKAVGAIYDFPAYKQWAEGWINGSDRSMESLKKVQNEVENEIGELQNMQEVAYSMGLDMDDTDGVKLAQFERARVVFHSAESVLNSQVGQVDQEIGQVFNGIEEFVDSESLSNLSDEIIKVA